MNDELKAVIEHQRTRIEELTARAEKCEREIAFHANDLAKRDLASAQQAEKIKGLRKALDAADRLAEMFKQYAEGSIVTLGDIGQEYEFYQAARALVGKAGGD